MAIYIAISGAFVAADEVKLWTVWNTEKGSFIPWVKERSFSHEYAVLGDGTATNSWAVDPWAGFQCRLSDYNKTLAKKLEYWTSVGKRIAAPMPEGNSWVEPTNPIIMGLTTKSTLRIVGAHEKFK